MVGLLGASAFAVANANPTGLIQNGDFSKTTNNQSSTAEFGPSSIGPNISNFIMDWTGGDGYGIWAPNGTLMTNQNASNSIYAGSGEEMLYGPGQGSQNPLYNAPNNPAIPAPGMASGSDPGSFVALDGDEQYSGGGTSGVQVQDDIYTEVSVTKGATYTVTFDWGAGQFQSRKGQTQTQLDVGLLQTAPSGVWTGASSNNTSILPAPTGYQTTSAITNPSEDFTGWQTGTMTFTANWTGSAFLDFLAAGIPNGLPPVATLANVSMIQAVPEPQQILWMFGGGLGLLGFGFFARRRQAHRRGVG
ncbi:MAG TPA: hypothetical protein VF292_01335 [Rhodanobacteraceae bacterium]